MQSENRKLWVSFAYQLAVPILSQYLPAKSAMRMPCVAHPDSGREQSTHFEALSRLLAGLAPWLNSNPTDAIERDYVKQLTGWAVIAISRFFETAIPNKQSVIDMGYLAQAFIRCRSLWWALPPVTHEHVIQFAHQSRKALPIANNWIVMAALTEAWLHRIGTEYDPMRIDYALRATNSWYKGDGVYGDGIWLQNDGYNSIVIHPGLLDILGAVRGRDREWDAMHPVVLKRAARAAAVSERQISPDGTWPVVGRSALYKLGVFHGLAHALHKGYYTGNYGAAQSALTACLQRQGQLLDDNGFLRMGFLERESLELAESYVSTGSLYAIALVLPILGIPEDHTTFWKNGLTPWTQYRIWNSMQAPIDKCIDYD